MGGPRPSYAEVRGGRTEMRHTPLFRATLNDVSSTVESGVNVLLRRVRSTQLRLVSIALLGRIARFLPLVLIYLIGALAYVKVTDADTPAIVRLLLGLGVLLLVGIADLIRIIVRGATPLEAAVLLDRTHGLTGRIANGLVFSQRANRTPLEQLAVDDAAAHASQLQVSRAAPFQVPPELSVCAALIAVLGVLSLVEVRSERWVSVPVAPSVTPFVLSADDQAYMEERAAELAETIRDPEASAQVHKLQQLLDDARQGRLDRKQMLERMTALAGELDKADDLDREALEEGFERLSESLAKNKHTKPLADALREQRLSDAEKALRELAERLKKKPAAMSRQELDRLRAALEAASRGNEERLSRIEAQRQAASSTRERLLKKKGENLPPDQAKANERALRENERELKRLDREKQKAERAAQQMSELDRELANAARELMKEMGEQAAKHLESGAQNLNQAARKQLSDEEKQALKKQIQELKELVRQAKAGSKEHQKQLEKFRKRAAGRPSNEGTERQAGEGGSPRLQFGDGQGGDIPIPVPGNREQVGQGPGQGQGPAGSGSGGEVRGEATKAVGKNVDVAAAGVDSGQGEVSSEVVYGAATRGFAGADYRNVFTEYKSVAEEALAGDEIPPGYKFYVRRYFQLIRPRD